MSRRNYEITLDEASPGMVLSNDLMDAQGKILLPWGAVLTEASIASLRKRAVHMIPILGEEIADIDSSVEQGRQQQRLARLFRKHAEHDTATEILCRYVSNFRSGEQS